jgi:hypothetical protein
VVQGRFDEDFMALTSERADHNKRLNVRFCDPNEEEGFRTLLSQEKDRVDRENGLISQFALSVKEVEYKNMRMYTTNVPAVSQIMLNICDQYVMHEDLVNGETEGIERKTMKELIKERERRSKAGSDPSGRLFHKREWPSLPVVMECLNDFHMARADSPSVYTKSRRRERGGGRQKEVAAGSEMMGEMMAPIESLDTLLSRAVIVERNKSYEEYKIALKKRLEEFQMYIESLRQETVVFAAYWQKSVSAIRPDKSPPHVKKDGQE